MRVLAVRRYGPPEVFEERDWPEPQLGPGDVLIRVRAVGVNFADLLQRAGIYPGTPKPPFVPGFEVAGVVERAGSGTPALAGENFHPNDRVVALTSFNGYAERVVAPARRVYHIPPAMPFDDAAATPVNYLTAYHSMFQMGNLQAGDRLLVHGAAGGVGVAAVQLAKARGLAVFGTAGFSKQEFLRRIGVDHPIDYTRQDFQAVVHRIAPEGIEMVMDPIGGKSFAKSYQCLGTMGRLVIYGFSAASGRTGKRSIVRGAVALARTPFFHPLRLMQRNTAIIGVQLAHLAERHSALLRRQMQEIFQMYGTGKVKPIIGKKFPLAEAAAAHRYLHNRQNTGKVILTVP